MYDEHFGLTSRPFQLTPDPRFWFSTATHRKAMAYLGYGLAQGEGFIVITGEIGAGKTTLVGHLVETIDPQRLNVIRLVSTAIHADDLLRTVATAFGIDSGALTKAELLTGIERALHTVARTGRRTLLVVDEVQALPVDSLEELRMLSNFQAGGHALLQILLLGQPEFRERLHGSDALEQLRQRVIAIHHLDPMAEGEIADYLAHRLGVAGWTGRPDFAGDAFAAFHRGSGGVPRRLNQLAGRTMLAAAMEGREIIDAALVDSVLADLQADLPGVPAPMRVVAMPAPEPAVIEPAEPEPVVVEPEPEPVCVEPEPVVVAVAQEPVVAVEPVVADEQPSACEDQPVEQEPVVVEPEPVAVEPEPAPVLEIAPVVAQADASVVARLAELEARIEQQDAALRRVLTLLVDWVDADAARSGAIPDCTEQPWEAAA